MKKVLVITYYFPPAGGAGVQRWLKTVKYLPAYDCVPIVLTVDENYASYPQTDNALLADVPAQLRVEKTKTHEILSAYKKLSPNRQIPYGGFANEGKPGLFQKFSRFVRGNFYLPDPRRAWNCFALPKAEQIIRQEGIDVVITSGPPHSTHLMGLHLKKKFPKLKWIADLRDPWTDIYYNKALYQTIVAKKINLNFERAVLLTADRLVTVSEGVKENFCSHAPVADKFSIIPNGYDIDDFKAVEPMPKPNGSLVVSYIGTLSPLYEVEALAEALKLIPKRLCSKLLLRVIGSTRPAVAALLAKTPVEIEYLPYQPHDAAIRYMCGSDILLIMLPKQDSKGILTGKFFEYLAARKPIVLIGAEDSELASYIRRLNAGRVFSGSSAKAFADYLIESMATPQCVNVEDVERFSRQKLAGVYAELIKSL